MPTMGNPIGFFFALAARDSFFTGALFREAVFFSSGELGGDPELTDSGFFFLLGMINSFPPNRSARTGYGGWIRRMAGYPFFQGRDRKTPHSNKVTGLCFLKSRPIRLYNLAVRSVKLRPRKAVAALVELEKACSL
jgi:hypothetical protein